jgi:hypothetical protein
MSTASITHSMTHRPISMTTAAAAALAGLAFGCRYRRAVAGR